MSIWTLYVQIARKKTWEKKDNTWNWTQVSAAEVVIITSSYLYWRQLVFYYISLGKKNNLVFRATVLKTLGYKGRLCFVFLRIETSIIKTLTEKKHGIFVKTSLRSTSSDR